MYARETLGDRNNNYSFPLKRSTLAGTKSKSARNYRAKLKTIKNLIVKHQKSGRTARINIPFKRKHADPLAGRVGWVGHGQNDVVLGLKCSPQNDVVLEGYIRPKITKKIIWGEGKKKGRERLEEPI